MQDSQSAETNFFPPSPDYDQSYQQAPQAPPPSFSFWETLKEMLRFLINPTVERFPERPLWRKFRLAIYVYVWMVGSYLLTTIFQSIGVALARPTENVVTTELTDPENPAVLFIMIAIVAPIIEELAYRLLLTRFSLVYIGVSGFVTLLLFVLPLSLIVGGIASALFIAFMTVMALQAGWREALGKWWNRRFRWVFWVATLAFGLLHVINFRFDEFGLAQIVAVPLLTLPQLVLGAAIGFIRARQGFIWAVFLHMLNNGVIAALVLGFQP